MQVPRGHNIGQIGQRRMLCVPEEINAVAVDPLESDLLLALLVAVAVVAAELLRVHALDTRTLYAKSER